MPPLQRCRTLTQSHSLSPFQKSRPSACSVRLSHRPPQHLLDSSGVRVPRTGRSLSGQDLAFSAWLTAVPLRQHSLLALFHPYSTRHGPQLQIRIFRKVFTEAFQNTQENGHWLRARAGIPKVSMYMAKVGLLCKARRSRILIKVPLKALVSTWEEGRSWFRSKMRKMSALSAVLASSKASAEQSLEVL